MNHPKITAAHKTVRTDFHGRLPVYYGASGEDHIVEFPDGSHAYEIESAGEWLLWRSASSVDAGGNVYSTRAAPASLAGICAPPPGRPPHTLIGDGEPIGVLEEGPRPVGRPPVAAETARVTTTVSAATAAAAAATGGQSAVLRRALNRHMVVTWQTPSGQLLDVCQECEARLHDSGWWPRAETGEYCQVSHGLHEGVCGAPQHGRPLPVQMLTLDDDGARVTAEVTGRDRFRRLSALLREEQERIAPLSPEDAGSGWLVLEDADGVELARERYGAGEE